MPTLILPFLFSACIFATCFVFANKKLGIVLFSSLFSLSLAICYTILNSPDVAITEAVLNVFLSSALIFVVCLTMQKLQTDGSNFLQNKNLFKISHFALFCIFCILFATIFYVICQLGEIGSILQNGLVSTIKPVNILYLQNSVKDAGVVNVVTSTLASYRGLDTMLETFVIFLTSFCIFFVLKKSN